MRARTILHVLQNICHLFDCPVCCIGRNKRKDVVLMNDVELQQILFLKGGDVITFFVGTQYLPLEVTIEN